MENQIIRSFEQLERTSLGFVLSKKESHWMILSSREESSFAALCRVCDKIGRVGTGESRYFLQSKRHWSNWILKYGAKQRYIKQENSNQDLQRTLKFEHPSP